MAKDHQRRLVGLRSSVAQGMGGEVEGVLGHLLLLPQAGKFLKEEFSGAVCPPGWHCPWQSQLPPEDISEQMKSGRGGFGWEVLMRGGIHARAGLCRLTRRN